MKCIVDVNNDIIVRNADNPLQSLHLNLSRIYCRLFETTREQSRDYLDEILEWADGNIENFDYVSTNIMHVTAAHRRHFGLKK